MDQIELFLNDEQATRNFASDIAVALQAGDMIFLHGPLGAGKTTLARALIRTVAEDDTYEVPSPTFTILQSYDDLRLPIIHVDLYRISSGTEIYELGLSEFRQHSVIIVEWPERSEGLLEDFDFSIDLLPHVIDGREGRKVTLRGKASAVARLKRSFSIQHCLAIKRS